MSGAQKSTGLLAVIILSIIPFTRATALPMEIHYQDTFGGFAGGHVGNEQGVTAVTQNLQTIMSFPQFDPSLGELLSARFFAWQDLSVSIETHCADIVYCNTWAQGGATSTLPLSWASSQLGVDLGEDLVLSVGTTLECSDAGGFGGLFDIASCSRSLDRYLVAYRDLTFSGDDLAGFIGNDLVGFVQTHGGGPVVTSLQHEGIPNSHANSGVAEGGGTGDSVLEAAGVVYDFWISGFNHTWYSDAHLYAASNQYVLISYTYEAISYSVPEPDVAWLLGLGLFILLFYRRKTVPGRNCF